VKAGQDFLHHLQVQGAKRIIVACRGQHRGESHRFVKDSVPKLKPVLRQQSMYLPKVLSEGFFRRRGMVNLPPIVGRNRQETGDKRGVPRGNRDWFLMSELEVACPDAKLEGVGAIQDFR
jgi:hypothetical protein